MQINDITLPEKKKRAFLPEDFTIKDWATVKPYYNDLLKREISSVKDLKQWFEDRSELEAVLSEDLAWRYIRMTCDTANEDLQGKFEEFITQIQPKIEPVSNQLNNKALQNAYLKEIKDAGYTIMVRELEKDAKIFREENIPLNTQLQSESKKYGTITGAMTVEIEGIELTLQQASNYLESTERAKREEAYRKIQARRLEDKDKLNDLFNKLVKLRHQVAQNTGFENYRDYMFTAMGRFDYEPSDCFDFHESVAEEITPIMHELSVKRKEALKVDTLRPWDKKVDISGKPPLKAFGTSEELVEKTIACFGRVDPYLGECLAIMRQMGHLDLDSRKGKAPGGYNYPLSETGVPFIFMNATSNLRDMVTIMHEGGHAVHSFLTRDLSLTNFKHTPSEVAELASMSMELISMDHWDLFFPNEDNLKRAKRDHLEQVIETLPWVATIDKFQHWIYENPNHSIADRIKAWNDILDTFSDKVTDWGGLQEEKNYLWQKQLHLYEVPFYYIEYGFAQLGAIAVWRNYKNDPKKGLEGYKNALMLGYTQSIPEIYEAAGIRFDFSREYIHSLIEFVKGELEKI
jgi:oligoendopeptidase F